MPIASSIELSYMKDRFDKSSVETQYQIYIEVKGMYRMFLCLMDDLQYDLPANKLEEMEELRDRTEEDLRYMAKQLGIKCDL